MGCFLIAAILGLLVHASNTDDINAKLGIKRGHWLSNVTAKDAHEAPAALGAALGRSSLVLPCFQKMQFHFRSAGPASGLASLLHDWAAADIMALTIVVHA